MIVSATHSGTQVVKALERGANDYLNKPVVAREKNRYYRVKVASPSCLTAFVATDFKVFSVGCGTLMSNIN